MNWVVFNTSNSDLPSNRSWFAVVDAHDNVWIATYDRGLAMFDGDKWFAYDTSNSDLPDNAINYLAIDAEGSVWIGTQSGGLAVLRVRASVDFNGDGLVDIKDLVRLIESWGQDDPTVDIAPPFGDGVIDVADLDVLMTHWQQDVDDPTLMARWALDEADGIIAYDGTGRCDATACGEPLWQPDGGVVDGALALDGIDDFMATDFVLDPSGGPFSVFVWVQGGAPGQVLVSQVGGANWLTIDASTGTLATALTNGGRIQRPLLSETVVTDDNWHRIGLTWDGNRRSLYVDDMLVAEDVQSSLASCTGEVNIGCDEEMTPATFWEGLIDDVRIYNRAVKP
jgi:hypothetical protein